MPRYSSKLRRLLRRWPVRIAGVVVVAAIALVVFLRLRPALAPPPPPQPTIPKAISKQVNIPLYYPTSLPSGMSVERNSFHVPASDVVVFDINSPDGSIAVSEQGKPAPGKLNIDDFIRINVLNSVEYLSPLGQATIGNLADGTRFGTLVTNGWVIVTGPQRVTSNDVRGVINAMNPVS